MYTGFNFAKDPEAAKWYRRAGFGSTSEPLWPNHSAYMIYGKEENHKLHPEWFAIHNGKRDRVDLCWTEPTLVDEWTRLAKEFFTKNPTAKMFPVMPEDTNGVCECERCQKLVDNSPPREGVNSIGGNQKFSNILWPAVNEVARRIRVDFPDKFIGCCAYSLYLKPPWNVAKFEPNVIVMFCAMTPFMFDSMYDKGMIDFEQGWLNRGIKTFSNWDYMNAHMTLMGNNGPYIPFVIPHLLAKRYSRLSGISRGGFYEAKNSPDWGLSTLTHYGMDHVNWYVLGKLSWDPTLNVDTLLDDYCKHFYGPAAAPMRNSWQLQEDQWTNRKDPLIWDGLCTSRWNHIYTPKVLRAMFATLDEARRLATDTSDPNYLKRLDLISGEYAVLRSCLVDDWKGCPKDSKVTIWRLWRSRFGPAEGPVPHRWRERCDLSGALGQRSLQLSGSESLASSDIITLDPGNIAIRN